MLTPSPTELIQAGQSVVTFQSRGSPEVKVEWASGKAITSKIRRAEMVAGRSASTRRRTNSGAAGVRPHAAQFMLKLVARRLERL